MSVFQVLLPAFVAGLIVTGMLAYLGVHVVERGVIFVDLSLAQIAALGTTVGILAGYDMHSDMGHVFSLGFALIGAAVFALSRVHRSTRIPQEAIIGIAYAVAAAAAILAMSKATGETEHLKEMLVGNILSVSWTELAKTAGLFVARGSLPLRPAQEVPPDLDGRARSRAAGPLDPLLGFPLLRLLRLRRDLLRAHRRRPPRLLVPDRSRRLGDAVLERLGVRLAIGWSMGAITSAIGVYLSYLWDLPTGATIVTTLGAGLVLLACVARGDRRRPGSEAPRPEPAPRRPRGAEVFPRRRDVALDLGLQLHDRGELALLAQAVEEEEADLLAVDVGGEVENERLDRRRGTPRTGSDGGRCSSRS